MKVSMPNRQEIYSFVDKYFVYLTTFFVLLIVFAGFTWFLIPVWQNIQGVDVTNLEEKEAQLAEAESFLSELRVMRDNYEKVDFTDIRRIEQILPKGFSKEEMFLQLQSFGKNNGLDVSSLSITGDEVAVSASRRQASTQAVDSGTVIKEVKITMGVDGIASYEDFKDFLEEVETYSPVLELASVRYPLGSTSASFTFTSYYLSE